MAFDGLGGCVGRPQLFDPVASANRADGGAADTAYRRPDHLVVDSTGLKVYGEVEWTARQHGASTWRTWRKLHLGINEATGEIVAETRRLGAKPVFLMLPAPVDLTEDALFVLG